MTSNLWTLKHYSSAAGQPAFSAAIHLNDMPCPEIEYPSSARTQANMAAQQLGGVLDELGRTLQIQRDLITGARLDPHKRHSVGVAMRRGEVDPIEIRPYQRRSLSADMPKISIIASCGVREVNLDSTYVNRVTQLALAITWACESLGIEVNAALMEGHGKDFLSKTQPIREAQLAYILAQPGRFTPLQKYAVTLDRDIFYGTGFSQAWKADPAMRRMSAQLLGMPACRWGQAFPGDNGGAGVHWARTFWPESDIVIGIGQLTDVKEADISLANHFTLESAVKEVIRQAEQLMQ